MLLQMQAPPSWDQPKKEKSPSKGLMMFPLYGGMMPVRTGTEPGTRASARNENRPIIARRPLLISLTRPASLASGVMREKKLKGSYRLRTSSGRLPLMGG